MRKLPRRTIHCYAIAAKTNGIVNLARPKNGGSTSRRMEHSSCFQSRSSDSKRVLIVGGGPTGLFLAHLLRSYNVPFRLVEAQTPEQRFQHPQAHFLNTRTMEILKHCLSYQKSNANNPNKVYEELRRAMPPVEEWMSFRFGPNMTCSNETGTLIADVIHPVDRPLVAKVDANGRLVPETAGGKERVTRETTQDETVNIPLSSESVGHLAQHKFCRILYDNLLTEAKTSEGRRKDGGETDNEILFGRSVTKLDWDEETRLWTVKTNQGEVFNDMDIVLAADGAASSVRRNLFTDDATTDTFENDSTMLGTPNLQRLINVHFEIPNESVKSQPRIPPAMLYTVFHPEVLAMVVRHGPGEYVLQIPYFEPYQTPEVDFAMHKVQKIVRSIVGENDDFVIHSVRPWTMGSLVAKNYYKDEGVFLVGDAAHVFPPAGGFGMNTGIQDAYSLAWRIALSRLQEEESQGLSRMGRLYERDRQPVARNNAALSVRNYQRVLNVMRACYLDDRHPALLIKALDATASFVPIEMRRQTFRTMLQTALSPLSQLQTSPNGIYARTIKSNLRELLGSGQGLPLLFPKHELDFSYEESEGLGGKEEVMDHWSQDSTASSPRLVTGALFPHIAAYVSLGTIRQFPRLQPIEDCVHSRVNASPTTPSGIRVSTRDLPAQLSSEETPIAFCLVEIVRSTGEGNLGRMEGDETLPGLKTELEGKFRFPFLMSRLIIVSDSDNGDVELLDQPKGEKEINSPVCDMYMSRHEWETLNLSSISTETSSFLVIRPDGHVAAMSSKSVHHTNNLIQGIQNSSI